MRRAAIAPDDFAHRVLTAPTFEATTLLVAEPPEAGFVHFGPRESWGFHLEDRSAPERADGVVYALCAAEEAVRMALLRAAETALCAAGARQLTLWPTWAQGTISFYNG